MRHHHQYPAKLLLVTVVVAVAASAGTAHAGGWAGKMTVEVTSGGSGKVEGWGANDGGNNNCPTKPWAGQASVHAGSATHASGKLKVTVEPSTVAEAGSCASQLPDGTYDIRFLNTGFGEYVGVEPARIYVRDCMRDGSTAAFNIGSITVASGYGMAQDVAINKPANHPNGQKEIADLPGTESAVCVAHSVRWHDGMQNPVTVI